MAEWFKAAVLKTADEKLSESSNPSSSKNKFYRYYGALTDWLCSGLQIRGTWFNSGTRLNSSIHIKYMLIFLPGW